MEIEKTEAQPMKVTLYIHYKKRVVTLNNIDQEWADEIINEYARLFKEEKWHTTMWFRKGSVALRINLRQVLAVNYDKPIESDKQIGF